MTLNQVWPAFLAALKARMPSDPRRRAIWLGVGGVLLLAVITMIASELSRGLAPTSAAGDLGRSESAGLPVGIEVGAKLVAVIFLIYGTAALARRYLLKMPSTARGVVHVIDATTLAPKKSIYVVEVGGRVLVLGATDAGITTLTQFDDPEVVEQLSASQKSVTLDFQRILATSLGTNSATI